MADAIKKQMKELEEKTTVADDDIILIQETTDSNKKVTKANLLKEINADKTTILNTIGTENMGTSATTLKGAIAEHNSHLNDKVNKTSIINNCNATEEGFVLDAMQGKYLNNKLNNIGIECVSIEEKSNNTNEYYGCLIEAGKTYLVIIDEHSEGTNISGIGIYILQSAMYNNSNCVTLKICDNLPINVLVFKNSENHIQVNFDSVTYSTIKVYKLK